MCSRAPTSRARSWTWSPPAGRGGARLADQQPRADRLPAAPRHSRAQRGDGRIRHLARRHRLPRLRRLARGGGRATARDRCRGGSRHRHRGALPAQEREDWQRDLGRVSAEFEISPALWGRWTAWIAEDSYWPQHSVLTHGEIYPAHTLVEGERISALLDWTTAAIGDPARDLMFHQVSAPPEIFERALEAYVAGGGRIWPRLAEHCTEMFSAAPVAYGLFALETGEAEHRAAAAAVLNPAEEP
ncbi:phosphotransferase [Brachybacterium sp. Z12]|uniref:phosphotransferase n=1 Tax=Brachybacterium sp. Z12 TaxID=2759167 RepID=UPI00186041AE|nr:phosphotransferase [Brachybacterium sp. Z12]QNN81922.1 phosphotransferase [Brachybacterium sp. Z12]